MTKFNFLKMMLLAVVMMVGSVGVFGQYSGTGTFKKITSLADLTDGYYVIANSGDQFAMNNTHNGTFLANTTITLVSGSINNPDVSIVWKIVKDGTNFTIYNEGISKYVSYTGSSNNVQVEDAVTSDNQKWNVLYNSGTFRVNNIAITTRFLQYNQGSPRFACYTGTQQHLLLYKMEAQSSSTTAPTFTPPAGTYTSAQNVELSSSTTGAKIYYTIDGTEPTNVSTPYSSAINVATTTTIKAIAYDENGENPSSVVSATYTIDLSPKITVTPATSSVIEIKVGETNGRNLNITGTNLTENLVVSITGDTDQFNLSVTSIEQTDGTVTDAPVRINYVPTKDGSHSVLVDISHGGTSLFTRTISGTAVYPPLAQPVASDATNISSDSFTANWGEVEGATEYLFDVYTILNSPFIEILSEDFSSITSGNSTASNGSGTVWDGNDNFPTVTAAYQAGGAVKLGTSSAIGSIASKTLNSDTPQEVKVTLDVKGWTTVEGNIVVSIGSVSKTIAYTEVMSGSFGTYFVTFPAIFGDFIVKIATSARRAFVDNVIISAGGDKVTKLTGSPFTTTSNNYSVTSLTPSTEYFYTITAKNANTTSPVSIEYMVMTSAETFDPIYRTVTSGNWSVASTWEVSNDNGETWVEAADVPSLDNDGSVIIQNGHEITLNSDEMISQVTIQPNGKLTVNPGVSFTATSLELQNDATGTATILGNVTGTVTINQAVEGMRSYYLGSPFSTLTSITGITGVATFDVTSDAWTLNTTDPKSAIPAIGNGFLAQVGDAATTYITLSGTLNAENVPFTLVTDAAKKFNYVGNPYPSYLNAKQLVEYNTIVEPSLWFRTKTGGAYQFETYNVPADVSIPAASAANNGFIAPLQGFWVKANETGTAFAFTDAMRTHNTTGVNLPLKAPKVSENKILRLQVINGSEFDETVVLFNSNAQNGFDKYDASKMMNTGANALNIYTKLGSDKLVLNSQSAIQYDSEIPLEVKTAKIGTFTIKANEFSNFGNFDKVQLKNEAGLITDLTGDNYTFTTSTTNATTRFALIFPSNAPTGTDNFEMKSARVMALDNRIIIDTNDSFLGTTVSVYNQVGQRVAMQTINSNKTEINGLLSAGVYLVKLNNQSIKVLLK